MLMHRARMKEAAHISLIAAPMRFLKLCFSAWPAPPHHRDLLGTVLQSPLPDPSLAHTMHTPCTPGPLLLSLAALRVLRAVATCVVRVWWPDKLSACEGPKYIARIRAMRIAHVGARAF